MTDNTKTKQGGQAANQGKQGDPSDWNAQKTGQSGQFKSGDQQKDAKGDQGQMGGKNPPSGGPDLYKPNQPMEGDRKDSNQGASRDPYPPTNPDRPVMAGGGDKAGQQSDASRSGDGNLSGNIGGAQGDLGTPGGLEEEE